MTLFEPKVVHHLQGLILLIKENPHIESKDGFFAFIEITCNDAESVRQILQRTEKESGCKDINISLNAFLKNSDTKTPQPLRAEEVENVGDLKMLDKHLPLSPGAKRFLTSTYFDKDITSRHIFT